MILHNYDECKQYPYIFNAVAFNSTVMEWIVVARVWLDKQTAEAYALAFERYLITALKVARHLKFEDSTGSSYRLE